MDTRLGYARAALSAVLLVATACAPAAPAPGPSVKSVVPGTSTASDQPRSGGRVIVGDQSDSKTLQPVLSTDTASSLVWARMYLGLIDVDHTTGAPVPWLAEKWEVSPDSKTMTFTLRDGLKWSDGSAFSGDDFTFTVEPGMRSKRTGRKNNFQDIIGGKDYRDGEAQWDSRINVDGKILTALIEAAS